MPAKRTVTSGRGTRESRELDPPVMFESLEKAFGRLRAELGEAGTDTEAAITLLHRPHLRVVASELRPGAVVEEQGTAEEYLLVVLDGSVSVESAEFSGTADAPALLSMRAREAWRVSASRAASMLLVVVEAGAS